MKNGRIIIILFIIIVFFVNPKTMESIKTYFNNNKIRTIKELNIDSNENAEILNYKNNLIFYDGKYLKALNEKGQKTFDLNIESKDFHIKSSNYIDILDKHNKIAYSIDHNGTIIFKKQFTKIPISFKSVNEKLFLYHYKYDKSEYIDLYGINNNKIKTIAIKGTITDLDIAKNNIILTYINTEEDLVSIIDKYDLKGNIINTNKFKDSMFIETKYLNDKFYCIDTNNIYILNDNLKVKEDIDIDNNIKFVENTKKYIVAIDDKNNVIHIDDKLELKKKNIMKDAKGISCYDNSYIVYSDNEIKSTIANKHDFDSKIYKIINISDKTIALLQNKKISLLYIN